MLTLPRVLDVKSIFVDVDRNCLPRDAFCLPDHEQCIDDSVLGTLPELKTNGQIEVVILEFDLGDCHQQISNEQIAAEFESRKIIFDPIGVAAVWKARPIFAGQHPHTAPWLHLDKWYFAAIGSSEDFRYISVRAFENNNGKHFGNRYAGVRR